MSALLEHTPPPALWAQVQPQLLSLQPLLLSLQLLLLLLQPSLIVFSKLCKKQIKEKYLCFLWRFYEELYILKLGISFQKTLSAKRGYTGQNSRIVKNCQYHASFNVLLRHFKEEILYIYLKKKVCKSLYQYNEA